MENIPTDLDEMLLEDSASQDLSALSETACFSLGESSGNMPSTADTSNTFLQQGSSPSPVPQVECDPDSQQPTDSWPEPKTKTGKARKRLALACIACRRKKIRCSGEKPACSHCSRSMIPCVYKVTPRAPAPRTDYMAMLGKRLKRMEDRVIKMIPKDVTRDLVAIGRGVVKPNLSGQTQRMTAKASKKRSAAEAFDAELKEWAKKKHVDHNGMIVGAVHERGDENSLLKEGAEHLPTADIQEHLAEVFFEHIYGQSYLLLHKPSFMRKLKAGMVPPVLMLAICAISARFSNHPQINSEPAFLRGGDWAAAAGRIVLARHDQPNITILTVLLILGLHEYGTCHGGRSWSFGGQALKMAYALQLHRESDYDPTTAPVSSSDQTPRLLTFTDREIRRRTMWGCILMDRFVSSGGYRPPLANMEFIDIQLPIAETNFQMEIPGPTENIKGEVINPATDDEGQLVDARDNMGVSAYVIKVVMIWGRVVDYMNTRSKKTDKVPMWSPDSSHSKLKEEAHLFAQGLPDRLKFTAENLQMHTVERISSQLIYLHIMIHQIHLLLNGSAISFAPATIAPENMPAAYLAESAKAAIDAASEISRLMTHATDHHLTAPFAGYCAFTASIVHIWCMFNKNPQSPMAAKENLRQTYRYLNKMKRYWGTFHHLVEATKERYRQLADAALKGSQSHIQMDLRGLEQYGGWFDRYPYGVLASDWGDSDMKWKSEAGDDAVMSHKPDLKGVEEFFADLSPPSETRSSSVARTNMSISVGSGCVQEGRDKSTSRQQRLLPGASRASAASASPVGHRRQASGKPHHQPGIVLPTRLQQACQSLESRGYVPTVEVSNLHSPSAAYPARHDHVDSAHQQHALSFCNHDTATAANAASDMQSQCQQAIYSATQQDAYDNGFSSQAQAHMQSSAEISAHIGDPTDDTGASQQGGQADANAIWNAPFNIQAVGLLDGFFQPGGWFLPFNIPSETPQADTSNPSAFPHPAHMEAHPTPQPIHVHEPYDGHDPHGLNHRYY